MGVSEGNTMGTSDETVTNGFPPWLETAIVCHLHICLMEAYFVTQTVRAKKKKKKGPV